MYKICIYIYMIDIEQTNNNYNKPSIIYDTSLNNNNLILFDDFSEGFYFYKLKFINNVEKIFNPSGNSLLVNVSHKCDKNNLHSLGIKLKMKNNINYNNIHKLQFSAKKNSNHKQLFFKVYNGNQYINLEQNIENEFNNFEIDIKVDNKFENSFRIGIINKEIDTNDDYIFEIKNITLVDINNNNNNNNNNEVILNIYLYNKTAVYQNYCPLFQECFKKIGNIIPCKISLLEKIPDDKIFGNNDILWVEDIRLAEKENYKNIFNKFIKENIIWYNFESPYNPQHCWWLDSSFLNNFGIIATTCTDIKSNYPNSIWIPLRSMMVTDVNKPSIIENLNYNKFVVANPFTHAGKSNKFTYNKFGNRGNIIKTLIDNNLNIDIYGKHMIQELKDYSNNYKGTIGEDIVNVGLTKIDKLSEYKFIIVCENLFVDGYMTEKLPDCLFCNRVLIYFGGPNIHKILPNIFDNGLINGFEFNTLNDLVNYLHNMSDEEYRERINTIEKERNNIIELFDTQNQYCSILQKLLQNKDINIDSNIWTLPLFNKLNNV